MEKFEAQNAQRSTGKNTPSAGRFLLALYRILLILVAAFGLSLFVLLPLLTKASAKASAPNSDALPLIAAANTRILDMGTLRAISADTPPSVVVLSVVIQYPDNDSAFEEELRSNLPALRQAIMDVLASKKVLEIRLLRGDALKTLLLNSLNERLILDSLETLYISDFVILSPQAPQP